MVPYNHFYPFALLSRFFSLWGHFKGTRRMTWRTEHRRNSDTQNTFILFALSLWRTSHASLLYWFSIRYHVSDSSRSEGIAESESSSQRYNRVDMITSTCVSKSIEPCISQLSPPQLGDNGTRKRFLFQSRCCLFIVYSPRRISPAFIDLISHGQILKLCCPFLFSSHGELKAELQKPFKPASSPYVPSVSVIKYVYIFTLHCPRRARSHELIILVLPHTKGRLTRLSNSMPHFKRACRDYKAWNNEDGSYDCI